MNTPLFLTQKLAQQLRIRGKSYIFKRYKRDKFHQKTDVEEFSIPIIGIYHEGNSYISNKETEGTVSRTRKLPTILTDSTAVLIEKEDEVSINGRMYRVTGVLDIQNYGIAYDVSLEEVI